MNTIEQLLNIEGSAVVDNTAVTNISTEETLIAQLLANTETIETAVDAIGKYLTNIHYIDDLLAVIARERSVSRNLVSTINETYPELLSTAAKIEDFTVTPTKTNVEVVVSFLESKKNSVKDDLYQMYTTSVHKTIESILKQVNDKDADTMATTISGELKGDIENKFMQLCQNKDLLIFKDGVLHKLILELLDDDFVAMLRTVPLAGIDTNAVAIKSKLVNELCTVLSHVFTYLQMPETYKVKEKVSYYELLKYLSSCDMSLIVSNYKLFIQLLTQLYNQRMLLSDPSTLRDDVIDKLVKLPALKSLPAAVMSITHLYVIYALYVHVCNLNEELTH